MESLLYSVGLGVQQRHFSSRCFTRPLHYVPRLLSLLPVISQNLFLCLIIQFPPFYVSFIHKAISQPSCLSPGHSEETQRLTNRPWINKMRALPGPRSCRKLCAYMSIHKEEASLLSKLPSDGRGRKDACFILL